MPYLCNLDYVMFGVLGVPLYRRHTCFADGDYCDFSLKPGAPLLPLLAAGIYTGERLSIKK